MNRYRIVTVTDNDAGHEEHVSPVVLTFEEAIESLDVEQMMHEHSGWQTRRVNGHLLCKRGDARRRLKIRRSTPFDDAV